MTRLKAGSRSKQAPGHLQQQSSSFSFEQNVGNTNAVDDHEAMKKYGDRIIV